MPAPPTTHAVTICDGSSAFSRFLYDPNLEIACDVSPAANSYGAVRKKGSIAIVERFIRSLKAEAFRGLLMPYTAFRMNVLLHAYTTWYNEHRPHQGLRGATPNEIASGAIRARDAPRFETRGKWPAALPLRATQGTALTLRVGNLEGNTHLPTFELREAA